MFKFKTNPTAWHPVYKELLAGDAPVVDQTDLNGKPFFEIHSGEPGASQECYLLASKLDEIPAFGLSHTSKSWIHDLWISVSPGIRDAHSYSNN